MTPTKRKKPRKPRRPKRLLAQDGDWLAVIATDYSNERAVFHYASVGHPKECRRLAAWLLKAADYLESRE